MQKNNLLKAALVILYDAKKRFLLQHRSADAKVLPGYWAFFGGGIKKHETPKDAVCREALEELNYILKDPVLFAEQRFELAGRNGHMYVYFEEFSGDKSNLKLNEGQGWGWYSLPQAQGLKMIGHDRSLLERLAKFLNKGKR